MVEKLLFCVILVDTGLSSILGKRCGRKNHFVAKGKLLKKLQNFHVKPWTTIEIYCVPKVFNFGSGQIRTRSVLNHVFGLFVMV